MDILTTFAQSTYTTTSTYTEADAAAVAAAFAAFMGFFALVAVIGYVINAIFLMMIFKKAGIKQTWAAWVPIYNSWKLFEIGGQQGYWAVLAIIPLVNIVSVVFMLIAMYNIGLKLGKSGAFVVLAFFLPIVWMIWLAVDSSKWDDTKGAPSLAETEDVPSAPVAPTPPTPPAPTAGPSF